MVSTTAQQYRASSRFSADRGRNRRGRARINASSTRLQLFLQCLKRFLRFLDAFLYDLLR